MFKVGQTVLVPAVVQEINGREITVIVHCMEGHWDARENAPVIVKADANVYEFPHSIDEQDPPTPEEIKEAFEDGEEPGAPLDPFEAPEVDRAPWPGPEPSLPPAPDDAECPYNEPPGPFDHLIDNEPK
jgi:hypothetical protein